MRTGNETVSRKVVITLRRATIDDASKLFEWRNDPEVRAVSESPQAITMKTHVKWLSERLSFTHPESVWMVNNSEGIPIGSARVEVVGSRFAAASLVIDKSFRNKGFGRAVIKTLKEKIESMNRVALARVHVKNLTSLRAFIANGFHVTSTEHLEHGSFMELSSNADRPEGR